MSAYSHPVASVYADMYADVHNTCLTYTSAHAWCSQHLSECMHILRNKNAHAPVHARLCNSAEASLPWKILRTCLESCASIVQAVVCRPLCCCLDEINRPTLFAQEIRLNPSYLMMRSPLWCRTSIIRSSVLVQASSSLSMVRTRSVANELSHHRNLFFAIFRASL